MKNLTFYLEWAVGLSALVVSLFSCTLANASLSQYQNSAFSDDFSSGTDAAWTHASLFAASTGQTWDATSFAYQLTALNNGFNPGDGNYGFAGSVVTSLPSFSNGYAQSDVLSVTGPGPFGIFGVGARLNGIGAVLGLTGYSVAYVPYDNSLNGAIELTRIGPPDVFNNLGTYNVSLTPGANYTFTLETTGSQITGTLWQQGQVGGAFTPLATLTATDAMYASGSVGVFVIGANSVAPSETATFDNFLVMVPEPSSFAILGVSLLGLLAGRRYLTKRA
jgi:PEP-CTERM motif